MNELLLYGSVGQSFWDEEHFTPAQVRADLKTFTGPVTIRINSGGGIATDGQAIYTALKDYPDAIHVVIDGIAASAASLIAMAGDTITMPIGSIMMIHDPANWFVEGRGTEADHLRSAANLRTLSNAYAKIYAARADIPVEEAREIMRAETYLDGAEALAAGFATSSDDEIEATAFAAFDYGIYDHAPQGLMAVAGARPRAAPRAKVLAMLAGTPPTTTTKPKGKPMAKTAAKTAPKAPAKTTASTKEDQIEAEEDDLMVEDDPEAVDQEDDPTTDTTADAEIDEPDAEEDEVEDDEVEDEPAVARAAAVGVLAYCERNNLPMASARSYISRGLTVAQINAERGGKDKKVRINPHGPSARITRDEVETRRTGIEGAIVARLSRDRMVNGPARDYMALSLPEMAAMSAGQRGRVQRGAGELRAIEMAFGSHSVSDFPAIFENALNKRLSQAYQSAQPTYRAIAERIDMSDFRPTPIAAIGDWPTLMPIGEGGEIKSGTVGDKSEIVALAAYGRKFHISRQMMVNDDLGAIDRLLSTRGRAVAAFEDQLFYAMLLAGAGSDGPTLRETGRQVFNASDKTKAASAAAITPAAVAKGFEAMMQRKGVGKDDPFLAITPSILLVGPQQLFAAQQLVAPIQAAQADNVNPYVSALQVVASPYITGNGWYLLADPGSAPVFMYGYLQGEEGPRMRMDEPFGQQGLGYSVELDFASGATDYRGGYKNAGG